MLNKYIIFIILIILTISCDNKSNFDFTKTTKKGTRNVKRVIPTISICYWNNGRLIVSGNCTNDEILLLSEAKDKINILASQSCKHNEYRFRVTLNKAPCEIDVEHGRARIRKKVKGAGPLCR